MKITQDSRNSLGMPLIGFGTYQLSNEEAERSVREAIAAGFRHIDSAEGYNNEQGTGIGIESSGVPRQEIFVTTKLFPGFQGWGAPDKSREATIDNLKKQLEDLRLDYVDLYLIHAPMSSLRLEQWEALVALKEMGLTKHIGVANYGVETLQEIIDAGLPVPEANQVEFHPICDRQDLTKYMAEKGIEPIAYSSLAPLSTWRREDGQGGEVLADVKLAAQVVIGAISKRLNVSEAKLLLRWGLQRGYAVLTKSSKPERIRENLQVFDFEIGEEDMKLMNDLNQNQPIAWAANGLNPMETVPPLSR